MHSDNHTELDVEYDLIGSTLWQDFLIALSIIGLSTIVAIFVLVFSGHSLAECLHLLYLILVQT